MTAEGVHGHVRLQEGRGMSSDISQISQVQAGWKWKDYFHHLDYRQDLVVHSKSTVDEVAPCRPPTAVRFSGLTIRVE